MNLKLMLGSLILALSFYACTGEDAASVDQDRIHTEYEVFYDQNTDKTTAIARFRFGNALGTLLELKSPSEVSFNGEVMPYNALLGAHSREYAGLVTGSFSFRYTNNDNQVFVNTAPSMPNIAYPAVDTISSAGAFAFRWLGTALLSTESVGLLVDGTNQSNTELFTTFVDGASELVLEQNRLQNLGLGSANCVLDRANTDSLQQGTSARGFVTSKYRARNRSIYIAN